MRILGFFKKNFNTEIGHSSLVIIIVSILWSIKFALITSIEFVEQSRQVKGHLPLKIVQFIMSLRTTKHAFYLTRHGQSEYNEVGRIGGDSGKNPTVS